MGIYHKLSTSGALPWRLRSGLQRWVETSVRAGNPRLYNLLHFGRYAETVRPLTAGPRHHFFGYYDKSPWNADGGLLLAHEVDFNDRAPAADDQVAVGLVRPREGTRFVPLAHSRAWNWQQGAMLQWHPADPARLFVHNDRRDGRFVGVVRDIAGREMSVYDRPLYALSPDGKAGYSLNFARLAAHRPGYGYAGGVDPWADEHAPAADGLWHVDLASGASRPLVSLAELAARHAAPETRAVHHWINHIQVSPGGARLAFFHLWRTAGDKWGVRLYTMNSDGGALRCVLDTGMVSHYDWLDDARLLAWARVPGVGDRFVLCSVTDDSREVVGEGVLTEDGHCSYSPDRRWVLNDTYPDRYDMRTLMLYDPRTRRRVDIARLHSPKARWWGEIRCDLHPRWRRDGRRICVDSVHEGSRQMYEVDVEDIVA